MNPSSVVPCLLACVMLCIPCPRTRGTVLTFETTPTLSLNAPMPQDYGDSVTTSPMLSANGQYDYLYLEANGWTPTVSVHYGSERPGESPVSFTDAEWPGVCRLWSPSFRQGLPIGDNVPGAMPAGFEYHVTFTPAPGTNRGVILNSFVLDDKLGYTDFIGHQVQWRVARGTSSGEILASGTATVAIGENHLVQTGLTGSEPVNEPVVLVLRRMSGIEDDLALDDVDFDEAGFPTTSYNTGSLGPAADGLNAPGVLINRPGAVQSGNDQSTSYGASQNTTIPFLEPLNPASDQPFTIEFWAWPTQSDGDDAPVFNRVSDGDRSGWVFFQRAAGTGWNLRMYDGIADNVGWDLTGGTSTLNEWSHVVAVWDGAAARLFVNGQLVDDENDPSRSGGYLASSTATFSVGAYDTGLSPFNGLVDEIAFYPSALTEARILSHYELAAGTTPGAYRNAVLADGALVYLQQNPPSLELTMPDGNPTLTFTGVLAQSNNLATWADLSVTSPYTVPSVNRPAALYFRVHR
jgi:hypothetical protein